MNENIIVDTGCANLSSVKFAVQRLGMTAKITDDSALIQQAKKVILPGVGHAEHAMKNIVKKNLGDTLKNLQQPVLGFCLGMQLMAISSSEISSYDKKNQQDVACLGCIDTKITALKSQGQRLPHMGWNTLTSIEPHPIFKDIQVGDYFYFVHSYAAPISQYTIASCQYGSTFSAAIAKNNFIGCQFHPERSGGLGSKIIKNFLEMPS